VVARRAALLATQSPSGRLSSQSEFPRIVVAQISPSTDARPFLRQVRQTLDGNLLHYTDRMRLLADADRMGIARFEANMLIATVQHRAQTEPMQSSKPPTANEAKESRGSRVTRIILLTSVLLTAEFLAVRMLVHAIAGV
jgi:hypothetical protein